MFRTVVVFLGLLLVSPRAHAQQISGLVTDAKGEPVYAASILLFSQDRDRWTSATGRYFGFQRSGQDGRFKVAALPPGEYYAYAYAAPQADATQVQNPDFLDGVRRDAVGVSLKEGETKNLELTLSTPR
jgi:hypothetical protein